ncbi:hypothetical protein [Zhongshania sp.]|uniref:hypothetical protein n=1 Tax=Zhongshania sp. TaxID=1971902 RepID=UPI0035642395
MNTYLLKADTDAELMGALDAEELRITDEEGNVSYYGTCGNWVLDWIGPISKQTGVDENGDPIFTTVPGAHCNLYSNEALPASLGQFQVSPSPATPHRALGN